MDCKSDSVTVTFLFLLMIAHLRANGIQININNDRHGEAEIFTNVGDVPFKSLPLPNTEDRELHRSKCLKPHLSILITSSSYLHYRDGNRLFAFSILSYHRYYISQVNKDCTLYFTMLGLGC